jgi:hypothetical protein
MRDPNPYTVAQWLRDEGSNTEFKSLQSVVNDILASRLPNRSQEEVSELAEMLNSQVIQELHDIAAQFTLDGIVPRYEILTEEATTHIRFLEQPELNLLKELQARPPDYFEHFCKRILEILGANASVEGGPGDGGVDFVAFGLPIGPIPGPSPSGARAVVIGQAKRYATGINISENDLRAFIGAVTRRTYSLKRSNPIQVGSLHPIVYAFWTTSDFHRNAREFAREMGLWYLNGIALAQLAMRIGINEL